MRGKDIKVKGVSAKEGITPAYAGKSGLEKRELPGFGDHPRVCGEKPDFSGLPPFLQGSPPRMRGKVFRDENVDNQAGITPAYAGKSTV